MKKIAALAVAFALVATPLGASVAEARHSSHYRNRDLKLAEALALLVVGGLVIAAMGNGSTEYIGAPWGVIDTEVKPPDTQVYVDGAYVGKTRDFDGWPGYLPLSPGTYHVEFRYPGHATFRVRARVLPGRRLVIKQNLRPLAPGERDAPPPARPRERDPDWRWNEDEPPGARRPEPSGPPPVAREPRPLPPRAERREPPPAQRREPPPAQRREPPPAQRREPERREPPRAEPPGAYDTDLEEMSELRLELTPEDASVYVDGEFYINGKDLEGGSRAILLARGEYRIEIVRPGYKTQSFTVVLNDGARTLKVQMERE
jgi:hypothetical protein